MYGNLKCELDRHNVTQREVAKYLNVHENSVYSKINGKSRFTVEEAFKIKERFFPNIELRYLFMHNSTTEDKKSA